MGGDTDFRVMLPIQVFQDLCTEGCEGTVR